MRQLHQSLRENHHLRHGGRMQYGLFLKGIGLSLEQALQFWRSEFIRGKVDADKVMLTTMIFQFIYVFFAFYASVPLMAVTFWVVRLYVPPFDSRKMQ